MTLPGTAVAVPKSADPAREALIAESKARTATIAALRGTLWGKECGEQVLRGVAAWCRQNSVDPRVVEVLGGRIYLTAEYYDEQGAPLIQSGEVTPLEPQHINNDDRLDVLMAGADEEQKKYARDEKFKRLRLRIMHNVPEDARAAVIHTFKLKNGALVHGVNWCGVKGGKKDPVGDSEPTKTALTRARRRAWRQISAALPQYANLIRPIEASAKIALAEPVEVEVIEDKPKQISSGPAELFDLKDATPAISGVVTKVEVGTATNMPAREREPGEEG